MSGPSAAEVRARLDHPVIDGDGHLIEFLPLVRDFIAEEAGADVAERFDRVTQGSRLMRSVPTEQRRAAGVSRMAWWGLPSANTLDRATALLPRLMYERLDEMGVDVALLYPTYGLTVTATPDDELRIAMARAFNRYVAEVYAPYRDRLVPVASIPMYTPEEAVAELNHAVVELGLPVVMMAGVIPRPIPGLEEHRAARYIDAVGHDSEHDYDIVWRRCAELGVSPTFHAGGQGWGTRASRTSYVYNHIGNFAAAGEAACRSLVLGGGVLRNPSVKFAFLEGGVAWAANLLGDLIGHFEKRNRDAIGHYDPAALDRDRMVELVQQYGSAGVVDRLDRLDEALFMLSDPDEDRSVIDEFADSGLTSVADIVELFEHHLFFGCEADDPMNALAFDRDIVPEGARLGAIFASDIGHWDVPDFLEVLPEAWELVEGERLTEADFRDFTFANAARLWGPTVFDGTAVEAAVRAVG